MLDIRGLAIVVTAAAALQGCASASGGNDPGARPLPIGQSCQSIRGELNRLDSRGVPAQVERASNGGKLSAAQRVDVDNYNRLLGQYLGSRCHV
ncbi:MAG: hypothetical protein CTY31_07155 [Hyphomicrobium sp.]|jgi:hypothetical protein|nr:MAG: hypothetical protein CTY39_02375 [Hyphomicrobium sp.]PPC99687.1 MAG: hypothetical protein CTY31_07155 [Hyphomicrobium sp.]